MLPSPKANSRTAMNYTEQLERETERTRIDLANTVEELRERLTPGEVLDEVLDYASSGDIGDYLRNFRRQVVDNPLPLGLMGVSVAWLIAASAFGGRRNGARARSSTSDRTYRKVSDVAAPARYAGRATVDGDLQARAAERATEFSGRAGDLAERASDRATDMVGRADDMAERTVDRASDLAGRAADQAARFAGRASDQMANFADQASAAAGRAGERVRSAASAAGANFAAAGDGLSESMRSGARAVSDAATGIAQSSQSAGRSLLDFGREQPLIVAATGLILGAVIGALLPSTQIEDELIGETSDAAKDRLREMAGEQYDRAKDVALRTAEAALDPGDVSHSSSHADVGGARESSSQEDSAKRHGPGEFGPGPGVHVEAEHARGDHHEGEKADHTTAAGA
jgi:Protein of unknown function (DUF3618)